MDFNRHSDLEGTHAFLSASQSAWVNYDLDQLDRRLETVMAAQLGTALHDWAAKSINLRRRQPEGTNDVMNDYINDAIGFRMRAEQPLVYSRNCFGTADTIGFRQEVLRIHDLKTGSIKVKSPRQLEVYAALFCLEYKVDPRTIEIELRIYQGDEVRIYPGETEVIKFIMEKIVAFDKHIERKRLEAEA